MKMLIIFVFAVFVLFFEQGCEQNNNIPDDGPTYGKIVISADQTLQPITDAEINAFQGLYTRASITAVYKPESEVFADLMNEKTKLVIATRELNSEEIKVFNERKIYPVTVKVAYDAVALISNKKYPELQLTFDKCKEIFNGKITDWKDAGRKNDPGKIIIVVDNKNSSTIRIVREKLNITQIPADIYALKNSREVVTYVSNNKNAIGVIGVNWIINNSDSTTNNFLKEVNVVSISPPDSSKGAGEFYQPYQAYIAEKYYPLWRNVYMINGEPRNGLGAGFIAFVAGEKGQRVILKSGLVPATMPVRLVEIKDQL